MSTSASGRPAGTAASRSRVPIAGPPGRGPAPPKPLAVGPVPGDPEDWPDEQEHIAWTPAVLKGWAGSVTLHALLLLSLAFWYFAPPTRRSIAFDSRLAGSPNGVPEGFELTGGLNTPLPMPDAAGNLITAEEEPLIALNPSGLEPAVSLKGAGKPSAAGGKVNDNPGAGDGDGFGLARFGEGGELVRGVSVKVGDPQFTLIWDTDADLDLHVIEPGGKEIDWEDPRGKKGGELDVDNTKGFGPENIYWLVDADGPGSARVKGPGPPGDYDWFVVYWGGFGGIAKPTHWKVRIKHNGVVTVVHGKFKALNERSRTYHLRVEGSRPAAVPEPVPAGSR
jgi:hypothetical protein